LGLATIWGGGAVLPGPGAEPALRLDLSSL